MLNQEQKEYVKSTIETLWIVACKGQTKPDSNSCAICQNLRHQAFECQHNIGLQTLQLMEDYFHGRP